jgi:copper(I)-binding protein
MGAHAQETSLAAVGGLRISAAWARAMPKGAAVAGVYVTVANTGAAPDRLIGASTAIAARTEIHEMRMDGGVMTMRPVPDGLVIAPGQTLTFSPNGYHLMLTGLSQPLTEGGALILALTFEKAGQVEVPVSIAGVGARGPVPTHAH